MSKFVGYGRIRLSTSGALARLVIGILALAVGLSVGSGVSADGSTKKKMPLAVGSPGPHLGGPGDGGTSKRRLKNELGLPGLLGGGRAGMCTHATNTKVVEEEWCTGIGKLTQEEEDQISGAHKDSHGESRYSEVAWLVRAEGTHLMPNRVGAPSTSILGSRHAAVELQGKNVTANLQSDPLGAVETEYLFATTGSKSVWYADYVVKTETRGRFVGHFEGGAGLTETGNINYFATSLPGQKHEYLLSIATKATGGTNTTTVTKQVATESEGSTSATESEKVGGNVGGRVVGVTGETASSTTTSARATAGDKVEVSRTIGTDVASPLTWDKWYRPKADFAAFRLSVGQTKTLKADLEYSFNVSYAADSGAEEVLRKGHWGCDTWYTKCVDIYIRPFCEAQATPTNGVAADILEQIALLEKQIAEEAEEPKSEGGLGGDGGGSPPTGQSNNNTGNTASASDTEAPAVCEGSLESDGGDEVDWWKIEVPAHSWAWIQFHLDVDNLIGASLHWADSSGDATSNTLIAQNSQALGKSIRFEWVNDSAENATLLLAVTPQRGSLTSYRFGCGYGSLIDEDETNDSPSNAVDLSVFDSETPGFILGEDLEDWYRIDVPQGVQVVASLQGVAWDVAMDAFTSTAIGESPVGAPFAELLYEPLPLDASEEVAPSVVLDGGENGETFYLRIWRGEESESAVYVLELGIVPIGEGGVHGDGGGGVYDSNDTPFGASILGAVAIAHGSVSEADPVDWWKIVVPPQSEIAVTALTTKADPYDSEQNAMNIGAWHSSNAMSEPIGDPFVSGAALSFERGFQLVWQNHSNSSVEVYVRVATEAQGGGEVYSLIPRVMAFVDFDGAGAVPTEATELGNPTSAEIFASLHGEDMEDWYKIYIPAGTTAEVVVSGVTVDLDIKIYSAENALASPIGSPSESSGTVDLSDAAVQASNEGETGVWAYVRVSRSPSSNGTYYRLLVSRVQ